MLVGGRELKYATFDRVKEEQCSDASQHNIGMNNLATVDIANINTTVYLL